VDARIDLREQEQPNDTHATETVDDSDTEPEPELPPEDDVALPVACPWRDPVAVPEGGLTLTATLPEGDACGLTLVLTTSRVLSLTVSGADSVVGAPEDEPGWSGPRVREAGDWTLAMKAQGGPVTVEVTDLGPPPGTIAREHSLAWTDSPLVDVCDLACLMARVAPDGHGGALLQQWFLRFATTAHSERVGPALMLEAWAPALGPAPEAWDLSLLPFKVTGVHSRTDLRNSSYCGELRVSLASTDPLHKPFHLIFLFQMPPLPGDESPAGALHCTATALFWASLSALPEADRVAAATARAEAVFQAENFISAETLEFLVAPWEWRQWFLTDGPAGITFENRPLFQTLDTPRLNTPGPDRDAFLEFVADNAAALAARTVLLPEPFRALSARVNQGVPWTRLDLTGLPEDALAAAGGETPLRQALEQIGCPGCHTADAPFVQTNEDRQFSPFYDKELDARAAALEALARGAGAAGAFGPLQSDFIGHP